MFFRIKKRYKSALSAREILCYIEHLKQKEAGFWKLKSKEYDVQSSENEFILKKRGGNTNGPAYPLIKGQIQEAEGVFVNLDISASYGGVAFVAAISCILSSAVIFSDKMTINGVVIRPDLAERVFWLVFSIGIPAVLCYIKDIRPVKAAEEWLVRKLVLEETPSPAKS